MKYNIFRVVMLVACLFVVDKSYSQLPENKDSTEYFYGVINPQKAKELYFDVFGKQSPLFSGNPNDTIPYSFYVKLSHLLDLAPYCTYNFYSGYLYEDSTALYQRMLRTCSDPAVRMMFVDDVVKIGERFVTHLDSINVLREYNKSTKGNPLSESLAKIRRAHNSYIFAHNPHYYPIHLYDKEKVYNLYRDAFKEFVDSKEQGSDELHAFYVKEYFDVCVDLYKSDEEKYYGQFLKDYLDVVDVCDKLLLPYDTVPKSLKDDISNKQYKLYRDYNDITNNYKIEFKGDTIIEGKYIKYYDTIPYGVRPLFKYSGAANHAKLEKYFSSRIDENINDTAFLASAVHLMLENSFMNNKTFYDYCRASYNLKPNYENSIGLGLGTSNDSIDKKRKFFLDALKLSKSIEEEVMARYLILLSVFSSPASYIAKNENGKNFRDTHTLKLGMTKDYDIWEENIEKICNPNLDRILKLSDKIYNSSKRKLKDYPGQACFMYGFNLRWMGLVNCNVKLLEVAKEYMQEAKRLTVEAKSINGIGVNIDDQLKNIEKEIKNVNATIAKSNRDKIKQAEYEEYLRKKKAEEAFWNQQ